MINEFPRPRFDEVKERAMVMFNGHRFAAAALKVST